MLKDKERLRKRTQLKRSVYKILGELEDDEEEEKEADRRNDQLPSERDSHLKDHNENIFDDDDFYHQVSLKYMTWACDYHVTCSCYES